MPLTVLNVAFPLARVGPDAVGGAEQVLWQLDRALTSAGHRSLVVAQEGSSVSGQLVPVPRQAPPLEVSAWHRAHEAHRAAIRAVLAREPVDVVHLHGVDFHGYLPPPGPAVLVTLHLPASYYPAHALHPARPRTFLHCVSPSQRALFPAGTSLLPDVPNGVDLEAFRPAAGRGSYALALGRICAEKGIHLALDAAARAHIPLLVAGAVHPFPEHLRYLDEVVRPRLDRTRRFLGPVGGVRKRSLLAHARCVVVASQVAETTSLVALEALASGTPVVALRRGALADVIEHGRTGLLVDAPDELAPALRAAGALSGEACRRAAEERFSVAVTVERYLALYERLARAPAAAVAARQELRCEEVTSFERLEAVARPWRELWERAPGATPFAAPAWILPWCRRLARAPPRALLVWRARELAALLPTFVYRDRGERVLGLLGGEVSDYQDLVAEDGMAAAAAVDWLAARTDLDRCDFQSVPERSPLLTAEVPQGLAAAVSQEDACPVLPLPERFEALSEVASAGLLEDARYQLRRMRREGQVEIARADAAALAGLLTELFRLQRLRWSARAEGGVLAASGRESFHAEAAHGLLAAGQLRLYALRLHGRTLGVVYGFSARRRAYIYLVGIDPAASRRSPGTVLLAHAVAEAIAEGAREVDFLRGRERYKYRWGARDRPLYRVVFTSRGAARPARAAPAPGSAPPSS